MVEHVKPVTPDEIEETYVTPTVVANRFIVATFPDRVRIAFGESNTPMSKPHFRSAVLMTPYDAYELMKVLERMLGPYQASIDAIIEANHGGAGQ